MEFISVEDNLLALMMILKDDVIFYIFHRKQVIKGDFDIKESDKYEILIESSSIGKK